MSYTGKIEDLIAERDELRATLTAVSDSLDYLHGMTPQQATEVRKDAARMRWLLDGNGYFMEEEMLCGHGSPSEEEKNAARAAIDAQMLATGATK